MEEVKNKLTPDRKLKMRAYARGISVEECIQQELEREQIKAEQIRRDMYAADQLRDEILERTLQVKKEASSKTEIRNSLIEAEKQQDDCIQWFVENPVSHPEWSKMVDELHAIEQKLRILSATKVSASLCGGMNEINTLNLK